MHVDESKNDNRLGLFKATDSAKSSRIKVQKLFT